MHEAGERALDAARRLGDIPMIAAALAELALADSLLGAPDRAEANHAEAATLVDSLSDDELAGHLEAATWLAGVELYLDRYAEGEAHANRALAVARATGQGELLLLLVATLGGLLRQRGKLAESAELLDGGIEAARVLGNTHALCWTLLGRSAAALRSGDTDLALATAQESVDLSQGESSFHSSEGAADLAAALLETGEPERAVELLLESSGGEELTLIAGSPRARYLEVLTQVGSRSIATQRRNVPPPPHEPGPRPCSCQWPSPGRSGPWQPSSSTVAIPRVQPSERSSPLRPRTKRERPWRRISLRHAAKGRHHRHVPGGKPGPDVMPAAPAP